MKPACCRQLVATKAPRRPAEWPAAIGDIACHPSAKRAVGRLLQQTRQRLGSYCSNNSYTDRSRKTENQQNFVLYVHKPRVGIVPIRSTWFEIGVR
jgi:hypothetical protein